MGLAGGPHCIAMCGAACAGIGQAAAPRSAQAIGLFQLGRVAGYSALGALAAASMQGLGWLTVHSAALRPVWTMVHVAAILLGLMLLIFARQPVWLDQGARRVWAAVRGATQRLGLAAPLGLGVAWALLPCGLLYSALLLAALSGGPVAGAVSMAMFALASAVWLVGGRWAWLSLRDRIRDPRWEAWGSRLAGLVLIALGGTALWWGVMHQQPAPWCLP